MHYLVAMGKSRRRKSGKRKQELAAKSISSFSRRERRELTYLRIAKLSLATSVVVMLVTLGSHPIVLSTLDLDGSFESLNDVSQLAYLEGFREGLPGRLEEDYVVNPSQTPLKDGAVRLGAGGALLALPFLYGVITGSLEPGEVINLEGLSTERTVL